VGNCCSRPTRLIADNLPSGNSFWSYTDADHFSLNCRRRACRKEESHEKQ
jgi:hypothetical protein